MINRRALYFLAALLVLSAALLLSRRSRAETITLERVVPPGATLTYSVGGSAVQSVAVPEGRVRVTIEFGPTPRPSRGVRR